LTDNFGAFYGNSIFLTFGYICPHDSPEPTVSEFKAVVTFRKSVYSLYYSKGKIQILFMWQILFFILGNRGCKVFALKVDLFYAVYLTGRALIYDD